MYNVYIYDDIIIVIWKSWNRENVLSYFIIARVIIMSSFIEESFIDKLYDIMIKWYKIKTSI